MKRFGIIIAIEEYSSVNVPELAKIEFAINDANSIKAAFTNQLFIEANQLVYLTNESANKANIEKSLTNLFSSFAPDDECYFYYVGHGFNTKSKNHLTCWDTDNSNLEETSIAIDDILFSALRAVECKKSFLFIDSSASEIKSRNKIKAAASDLVEKEYSELVRSYPGNSIFLACMPGEKSFSSNQAKHGIWNLQLLNAINGKDDVALDKNNSVTNISLGKFLSSKIPQYITKTMVINDRQNPYSVVDAATSSTLIAFESDDESENKNVEIQFKQYVLSREQQIPFKNFESFNKARHKIPKDHNDFALKLANELAQDQYVKVEIEALFDKSRKNLRLKNSNTVKDPAGGSLHTEFFRFNIYVEQSESDCSQVTIRRELELRVPLKIFPMPIDEIFTEGFDTITFPIKGTLAIDALEDALYDLEDDNQGTFENKDNIFYFFPKNIKGISKVEISQKTSMNTLKIRFASSQTSVTDILDYTQKTLEVMAATLKNLLS